MGTSIVLGKKTIEYRSENNSRSCPGNYYGMYLVYIIQQLRVMFEETYYNTEWIESFIELSDELCSEIEAEREIEDGFLLEIRELVLNNQWPKMITYDSEHEVIVNEDEFKFFTKKYIEIWLSSFLLDVDRNDSVNLTINESFGTVMSEEISRFYERKGVRRNVLIGSKTIKSLSYESKIVWSQGDNKTTFLIESDVVPSIRIDIETSDNAILNTYFAFPYFLRGDLLEAEVRYDDGRTYIDLKHCRSGIQITKCV